MDPDFEEGWASKESEKVLRIGNNFVSIRLQLKLLKSKLTFSMNAYFQF